VSSLFLARASAPRLIIDCVPRMLVESGEKYKTGSNTFNFLADALYRSCDEQRNNCYDFANSQYGQTSVSGSRKGVSWRTFSLTDDHVLVPLPTDHSSSVRDPGFELQVLYHLVQARPSRRSMGQEGYLGLLGDANTTTTTPGINGRWTSS
jgi:hypothetical protein